MRKPTRTMLAKAINILSIEDLYQLARAYGLAEPERSKRLDVEYALLAVDKQQGLVRMVAFMVARALNREIRDQTAQERGEENSYVTPHRS